MLPTAYASHIRLRSGITAVLLLMVTVLRSEANDEIRVRLTSGREFSGVVDQRTDDERLWLRCSGTGIEVIRPIRWQRITETGYRDKRLSIEELKRLAAGAKSRSPIEASRWQHIKGNRIIVQADRNTSAEMRDRSIQASDPIAGPVRSVNFDAQMANWDGDVEMDGLLVRVYLLSAAGSLTPVDGTLTVALYVPRRRDYNEVPHGRGMSVDRIGRWSRLIHAADLTPSGVVVKLPFQAVHPEFDNDTWSHGLVHLRLVVPGQGVFEDLQDGVRLDRVFEPVRNLTGHRFLAHERTARGKR